MEQSDFDDETYFYYVVYSRASDDPMFISRVKSRLGYSWKSVDMVSYTFKRISESEATSYEAFGSLRIADDLPRYATHNKIR